VTPAIINTRRQRAYRRGIELKILTWADGTVTALVRPVDGDIETCHGPAAEVLAWIDARIPRRMRFVNV
jgi:hypothetical protein